MRAGIKKNVKGRLFPSLANIKYYFVNFPCFPKVNKTVTKIKYPF